MKQVFFLTLLIISFTLCTQLLGNDAINQSKDFQTWLLPHKKELETCIPTKLGNDYKLCDNTLVNKDLLIKLFKMSAEELVNFIKDEHINLKVFCKSTNPSGNFQKYCIPNEQNKAQKEARLQGQFHPDTNTIDIQSDAYLGSLIHEYIHYLQFKNENNLFGKRYKFERAKIQQDLISLMDSATKEVENYQKANDEKHTKESISKVLQASDQLMQYSPWQDLIDERSLFLLYKNFGHEFGVRNEDLALSDKNMGFICKRFSLSSDQCPAKEDPGLVGSAQTIELLLKEIRPKYNNQELEKFIKHLPILSAQLSIEEKIKKINHYLFDELKMHADNSYMSRNNLDNILPDSTLKFKKAHCLGLSVLYLIAAEKLMIKAYLVRAPGHVFVRYCDSNKCLNIESLKKGEITSDQYYIDNLFITKKNIEEGHYLKNLSANSELLASLYLGLGFVAGTNHQEDLAEYFYKKSIDHSRGFAEAYSNLAAIYFQQKKLNMTRTYLDIALKVNPDLVPALINMGALNQGLNKMEEAQIFYDRALAINPTAIQAYRKKAAILMKINKSDEAFLNLEKILIIQPNFCDVMKDQLQLTSDEKIKVSKQKAINQWQKKHQCLELPL